MNKVGDTKTETFIRKWHECQFCELPARYRIGFTLPNARSNPASSGYGKDDISWCSDDQMYACEEHKKQIEHCHDTMIWCSTIQLKGYKHMGFYWDKVA
ncbi:MAG TPA: hypothetical protein ENH82_10345 [bacterium]|nr:hypothetical protein [bacterium]